MFDASRPVRKDAQNYAYTGIHTSLMYVLKAIYKEMLHSGPSGISLVSSLSASASPEYSARLSCGTRALGRRKLSNSGVLKWDKVFWFPFKGFSVDDERLRSGMCKLDL